MRIPLGYSDFQEIVKGDFVFIGKSMLIKDIIEDGAHVMVITRPRGASARL